MAGAEDDDGGATREPFEPFEVVASDGAVFTFTSAIDLREFIAAASKTWGWLKHAQNSLGKVCKAPSATCGRIDFGTSRS